VEGREVAVKGREGSHRCLVEALFHPQVVGHPMVP
jgi:hypothetical protein